MTGPSIFWRGQPIDFVPGETVAMALTRAGIVQYGSHQSGLDRALFCGIGQCQNCLVEIENLGLAEACLTLCENGLSISPIKEIDHD